MRRVPDGESVLLKGRLFNVDTGTLKPTTSSTLSLTIDKPDGTQVTNTLPLTDKGTYRGVISLPDVGVTKISGSITEGTRTFEGSMKVLVESKVRTRRIVREPGDEIKVEVEPWVDGTANTFDTATFQATNPDGTQAVSQSMTGANGVFSTTWTIPASSTPGSYPLRILLTDSTTSLQVPLVAELVVRASRAF